MDYRRRESFIEPGQHLLLPTSVFGALDSYDRFAQWSGLQAEQLIISPLSATAIPDPAAIPEGQRRWPGIRPEAMWHPLMWLPERMTQRRLIRDEATSNSWVESIDEWVVRVLLELSDNAAVEIDGQDWVLLYDFASANFVRPASAIDTSVPRLYDAETGTWLDVLATVGLDVDNAIDLGRVEAWLEGEPDALLDGIDLEDFLQLDGRSPDWALERTQRLLQDTDPGGITASYVDDLRDASAAMVCTELAQRAGKLAEPDRLLTPPPPAHIHDDREVAMSATQLVPSATRRRPGDDAGPRAGPARLRPGKHLQRSAGLLRARAQDVVAARPMGMLWLRLGQLPPSATPVADSLY